MRVRHLIRGDSVRDNRSKYRPGGQNPSHAPFVPAVLTPRVAGIPNRQESSRSDSLPISPGMLSSSSFTTLSVDHLLLGSRSK